MGKNLPKPIKSVLGILPYFIAGVVLAVVLLFGLGAAFGVRESIVTVMSNSMVPNLYKGDLVVLAAIKPADIRFGEQVGRENATIVVYPSPQDRRLIIHRAWHKNEDGTIVTWGDANSVRDPWNVTTQNIRGAVVFRIPFLGWPRVLLNPAVDAFNRWRGAA